MLVNEFEMKARFTIDGVQLLAVVATLLLGVASVAFVQAAAINVRLLFFAPLSHRQATVTRCSWPITMVLRMRS